MVTVGLELQDQGWYVLVGKVVGTRWDADGLFLTERVGVAVNIVF